MAAAGPAQHLPSDRLAIRQAGHQSRPTTKASRHQQEMAGAPKIEEQHRQQAPAQTVLPADRLADQPDNQRPDAHANKVASELQDGNRQATDVLPVSGRG